MSDSESGALAAALGVLCDSRRQLDEERSICKLPDWVRARHAMERYYHGCGQILARLEEVRDESAERAALGEFVQSVRSSLTPYKHDVQAFIAANTGSMTEVAGLSEVEMGFRVVLAYPGQDSLTYGQSLIEAGRSKLKEMLSALHGGEDGDDGPDMGCAAWLTDPPSSGAGRAARPFPPEGPE